MLVMSFMLSCSERIAHQKKYLYSVELLAKQQNKIYQPPYNTVIEQFKREIIIREYLRDSTGNEWNNIHFDFNKKLLIQVVAGYPNRYLIANIAAYQITIMDIPLQGDSLYELSSIHGQYLGEFADTTASGHFIDGKLIVSVPYKCSIEHGGIERQNYTDVTVLYDMNANGIFPIEILDFKCHILSDEIEDKWSCFCRMSRAEFKQLLHQEIVLAKPEKGYPFKFKKFTKRK